MNIATELQFKHPVEEPAHETILNIYYTASRMKKLADEFFRSYGTTDVQFNVMMLLKYQSEASGGLTQVDLSRMMLVNRANITSLIDRMEKVKLVERGSAPDDRRYHIVRLTTKGEHILEKVGSAYIKMVKDTMGALNSREQENLIRLLEKARAGIAEQGE